MVVIVILKNNLSGVKYGYKSVKLGHHVLHYFVKLQIFNFCTLNIRISLPCLKLLDNKSNLFHNFLLKNIWLIFKIFEFYSFFYFNNNL